MAPDSAQKIANAATAVHAAPVKSRCEKTSPAKTNRFLTHCRGRIETTIASSIAIARLAFHRPRLYARDCGAPGATSTGGRGREDHAARVRCSAAAELHLGARAPAGARRERVPSTPPARARRPRIRVSTATGEGRRRGAQQRFDARRQGTLTRPRHEGRVTWGGGGRVPVALRGAMTRGASRTMGAES